VASTTKADAEQFVNDQLGPRVEGMMALLVELVLELQAGVGGFGGAGGVDDGEIEETAQLDESYTPIPLKHLASCQIGGSR